MKIEELKDQLNVAITFLESAETEPMKVAQASVQPISKKDQLATFFFRITPTVNMTIDGNHPLVFIIHHLEALGTARTFCYLKPDGCIENWDVYLSTTISQTELETRFLIVENECQVACTKLLAYDLFSSEEFTQFIEHFADNPTDPEEMIAFVQVIALNVDDPPESEVRVEQEESGQHMAAVDEETLSVFSLRRKFYGDGSDKEFQGNEQR